MVLYSPGYDDGGWHDVYDAPVKIVVFWSLIESCFDVNLIAYAKYIIIQSTKPNIATAPPQIASPNSTTAVYREIIGLAVYYSSPAL